MRNIMKKFVLLTALVIVVVAGSESVKATQMAYDTGWFTVDKPEKGDGRVYNGSVKVKVCNKDNQSHYLIFAGKRRTLKAGQSITLRFDKTADLRLPRPEGGYDGFCYKVNPAKKGFEINETYNEGRTSFKVKAAKGYTVTVKAGSKKYTVKSGKTKSLTFNKETIVSIRAKDNKKKKYTGAWAKYTVQINEKSGFDPEKYGKINFENGDCKYAGSHVVEFNYKNSSRVNSVYFTIDGGNTWSKSKATLTKSKYEGSETFTIGMYVVADGVKSATKWYTLTLSLLNPVDGWYKFNPGVEPVKYLSLENAVNKRDGHIYSWESIAVNAYDIVGMDYEYSKYTTDGSDPRTSATAKIYDGFSCLDYGVYRVTIEDTYNGVTPQDYLKTVKIVPYYTFRDGDVKSEPLPMHVQSFDVSVITQLHDVLGNCSTYVDGVRYITLNSGLGNSLVSSAPYAIHSYVWYEKSAINVPIGETVSVDVGTSYLLSTYLYGGDDTDEAHARERGKKATIKRVTDMSKLSQY